MPAKLTPATLRVWLETKNVGNDESAADEWAGFVRKRGIKTAAQAFACLDWCIRRARQSGRPVRYAKDVEDFGQQWRDMTKETERMSKESA